MKSLEHLRSVGGLQPAADVVRQICDSIDVAPGYASTGDAVAAYVKVREAIGRATSMFRSGAIDRIALLRVAMHSGEAFNQIEAIVATGVGMVPIPRIIH